MTRHSNSSRGRLCSSISATGRWDLDSAADDGVVYNLRFDRYKEALHTWRYPDLTRHVTFLADALDVTIEQEMRAEAQYLQRHGAARARLKNIVEGPDSALDRIIRSVRDSHGALSGKLRTEYPILERTEIRGRCGARNSRGISEDCGG